MRLPANKSVGGGQTCNLDISCSTCSLPLPCPASCCTCCSVPCHWASAASAASPSLPSLLLRTLLLRCLCCCSWPRCCCCRRCGAAGLRDRARCAVSEASRKLDSDTGHSTLTCPSSLAALRRCTSCRTARYANIETRLNLSQLRCWCKCLQAAQVRDAAHLQASARWQTLSGVNHKAHMAFQPRWLQPALFALHKQVQPTDTTACVACIYRRHVKAASKRRC
jgi:hypothetical protein